VIFVLTFSMLCFDMEKCTVFMRIKKTVVDLNYFFSFDSTPSLRPM
jgi:hypothetical protein